MRACLPLDLLCATVRCAVCCSPPTPQVSLPGLALGCCSNLVGLEVSSDHLSSLDVRGCARLQHMHLECPKLMLLDAGFCSSLEDEGLVAALLHAPTLQRLMLSVCLQVRLWGGCRAAGGWVGTRICHICNVRSLLHWCMVFV